MIDLSALWGHPRIVSIGGRSISVPLALKFGRTKSCDCSFISKWIQANGVDWTVGKMKDLKTWALQILAGNHSFSISWFHKIHYKGYIIPGLDIFKYLVDSLHNIREIKLILIVLNSYKLVMCGKPSLDSIIGVPKSPPTTNYCRLLCQYVDLPHVPKFALEGTEAWNTKAMYCDDFGETHEGPYGLFDSDFPAEISLTYKSMNEDPLCVGRILPIPDKGKYRVILVGNRAVQLQTKKLADWLRNYLWSLPEVASGNQQKMVQFVLDAQKANKTILSIDLSNATDRLSVEFQRNLLIRMGVPDGYFRFLRLPFYYQPEKFGMEGKKLSKSYYSNGQPMGLFISFPMFELAHYVILKYVVAVCKAAFCICGDDVVIACDTKDSSQLFKRYKILIERMGGEISLRKTMVSERCAEGVGAIFLKGYPKEIRIPSGKLSLLELFTPGTWVYEQVHSMTAVGRALLYPLLSRREWKEYTYDDRRALNELFVNQDLSDWRNDSLQSLAHHENYPQKWRTWEDGPSLPLMKEETGISYKWVTMGKFHDALVSHKIITLYKQER